MKKIVSVLAIGLALVISGFVKEEESVYNSKKGVLLDGIDVVSILSGKAIKGNKEYSTTVDGVHYYFSSAENLKTFSADTKKYTPAFGGWCAYAMTEKPQKVEVDPNTYKVVKGQLLLFYNAWGINTLKKWNEWKDDEKYFALAQKNWEILKAKK